MLLSKWPLTANKERYKQRRIDSSTYVIEYYDERFDGNNEDSMVVIWIPIEKIK